MPHLQPPPPSTLACIVVEDTVRRLARDDAVPKMNSRRRDTRQLLFSEREEEAASCASQACDEGLSFHDLVARITALRYMGAGKPQRRVHLRIGFYRFRVSSLDHEL